MLLTTFHFLKPFCFLAVRSSLMVELSGDLSTPYAKAHLVRNHAVMATATTIMLSWQQLLHHGTVSQADSEAA